MAHQMPLAGAVHHITVIPVQIMAVEGFNPLGVQAFNGWRCGHGAS